MCSYSHRFSIFLLVASFSNILNISPGESTILNTRDRIRRYSNAYKTIAAEIHDLNDFDHQTTDDLQRTKRDVIFADTTNLARRRRKIFNHEDEGTFIINQVERATPQYYDTKNAFDINCQRIQNKSFVFSIENTENGRKLLVHQLNERDLKQQLIIQADGSDAVSVDVFSIKNEFYAFTTVNHEPRTVEASDTIDTGSTLYRINTAKKTLDKTQTIHLPFARSSDFWVGSGEEASDMYLAIAPEKAVGDDGGLSYNVMVACYRWQGGYFDYVSQVPAKNPQSIQHFVMFSHDYLTVANYQDDTGSTNIQSEIFKYHHKESRFVSFQKIQTYGAKDIRHFTFESADAKRQEHFIAIANHCKKDEKGRPQFRVQSTIMKFGGTRYIPFKSFYTNGALQFLPVKHGKKFYLAMADLNGIRVFQYNGWTFVQTFSKAYDTVQDSPFSIKMRQLNNADKSFFTVASNSNALKNGMYSVGFETRNDHRKLVSSVETWCDGATRQMSSKNLTDIEFQISSAPKITDKVVSVKGTVTFTKGVEINSLKSQELGLRGRSLGGNEFKTLAANERRFRNARHTMETLDARLDNVIWVDRDQVIEGNVFIRNLFYHNPTMRIKNLQVERLGSKKASEVLDNVVFLNQPQTLGKIITKEAQFDTLSTTSLNGRPLSDYALRHPTQNQVFTGRNEFLSNVVVKDSISVGTTFAGLSFSQPNFLLSEGNQTFQDTTMTLNGAFVENLYTRSLNGHELMFYFADAVPLSGGVITAEKHFKNVKAQRVNVESLNNVDINNLYASAIFIDGRSPQSFTGATYFENLKIEGMQPANPMINQQYDMSTNFINILNGNYKIKGLTVAGNTDIQGLFVKSQLNNIKVNDGKLDVLLANSAEPQRISAKTLDAIHFSDHVEADELVDGIELSTWSEVQEITLTRNFIDGILNVQGNLKASKNLIASKSFMQDGADVFFVLKSSAPLDAEMLPNSCRLQFESLEVDGNSDIVGKINDIEPGQWVINNPSQQVTITAEKTFLKTLHLEKDSQADELHGSKDANSENIFSVFPSLLLDGVDQTITQSMAFSGAFLADTAFCPNTILNEVPYEDLLFTNGDQEVEVNSIFRQSISSHGVTSVEGSVSTVFVNEIDINKELQDTLRTGKEFPLQTVTANYNFAELKSENAQVFGTFASSNVQSIYGNIILKNNKGVNMVDGSQLSFTKGATMDRLQFIGHVNGIHSSDWGHTWLLKKSDQKVFTKVEFAGPVTANQVHAHSVNNIDIAKLSSEILRIDKDESIQGSMMFMNSADAVSGIVMPQQANVNGIDMRNDVLLKSSPNIQVISGEKKFTNGISVNGNMFVKEISGFDIANFVKLLSFGMDGVSAGSLTVNGNMKLTSEPDFTNKFNEHVWNDVLSNLWFRDKNVQLPNTVQFSSLKLLNGGKLSESSTLNGIDLKDLEKNYASKSKDQVWTGLVKLKQVDQVPSIEGNSLVLENGGLLNGVDLNEFYNSVLRYSGDQNIHGSMSAQKIETLRLDTSDEGTLNSIMVPVDLMTVNRPNKVSSTKSFQSIQADTVILSPETVIAGVNIGAWQDNAVKRDGSNMIMGPLEFTSLKMTDNVVVDGTVDGVQFDTQNIFTTDIDQEIFGHITIEQPESLPNSMALTASKGLFVEGTLNGIDIKKSISKLVFTDVVDESPLIIRGETKFDAPVALSQVKAEGLLQGQNVTAMMGRFTRTNEEISNSIFNARERYGALLNAANTMLKALEKRSVFLDHYIFTQTIQVAPTYIKVLENAGFPSIAIGFKKSELITTENRWSYNAAVDYYQLQIGNRVQFEGVITDIAELPQGKETLFAFAINSAGNGRPAQVALEVMNTVNNFEINKSPDKLSKTFILKSVDVGTPNVRPAISQVMYSNGFKSLRSFSLMQNADPVSCLATTEWTRDETESAVKILCLDNASGVLESFQDIKLDSPSLTTSTIVTNTTLLGILTRSSEREPEGLLEFWSHSGGRATQFTKQHCLPVFNAISIDTLSTNDGRTFLAVVSGGLQGSEYQGSVFMYRYSKLTQQFKKIQTIDVSHPKDVKLQWLKPSNQVIAYVLSESATKNVQVYTYKGLLGWNLSHQFTSANANSIHVSDFTVDGTYRAQLLAVSSSQTNIYAAEFVGLNTAIEETVESENIALLDNFDVEHL